VALALLAGAPGAEDALRYLVDNGLGNGLDGPQGLADSAQWVTGAANPTSVPSWADNWNITLSTMALMEFLDGPDRTSLFFANLPEVKSALDTVFVAGDYDGNGAVGPSDYNYWRQTFGNRRFLAADANIDGAVDAADYVLWRKLDGAAGSGGSVPEPNAFGLAMLGPALSVFFARKRAENWKKFLTWKKPTESACSPSNPGILSIVGQLTIRQRLVSFFKGVLVIPALQAGPQTSGHRGGSLR
jgi:hypothetical protein